MYTHTYYVCIYIYICLCLDKDYIASISLMVLIETGPCCHKMQSGMDIAKVITLQIMARPASLACMFVLPSGVIKHGWPENFL